jgi:hypothetical protein
LTNCCPIWSAVDHLDVSADKAIMQYNSDTNDNGWLFIIILLVLNLISIADPGSVDLVVICKLYLCIPIGRLSIRVAHIGLTQPNLTHVSVSVLGQDLSFCLGTPLARQNSTHRATIFAGFPA